MFSTELPNSVETEATPEAIREQLELLVQDHVFRSSKRSVQFLRYVEQTLNGAADCIKKRIIGVEVFHRDPPYDTTLTTSFARPRLSCASGSPSYYGEDNFGDPQRNETSGSFATITSTISPSTGDSRIGQLSLKNSNSKHATYPKLTTGN